MTTRQIYNRLLEVKFDLIESMYFSRPNLNKLNKLIVDLDNKATLEAELNNRIKPIRHEADIA